MSKTVLNAVTADSFNLDNPFEVNPDSQLASYIARVSGSDMATNIEQAIELFDRYVAMLWEILFGRWIQIMLWSE